MEIKKTQQGDTLEIKVEGRLDGHWADHLKRVLMEDVREGAHKMRVDLERVDFISSAGIGALVTVYKQLLAIHGSFAVCNPSKNVQQVLNMSGLESLLTQQPVAAVSEVPSVPASRPLDLNDASMEVFDVDAGAKLKCRTIGNPDLLQGGRFKAEHCRAVSLPDSVMALGLGALGHDFEDCRTRFGEFLAIGGAAAYQPSGGAAAPDYMVSAGSFVPVMNVLYGVCCEGAFASVAHFERKKDAKPIAFSDLTRVCLDVAGTKAAAIVVVAETAGLLGAALRRSPAAGTAESAPFAYPGVRDWLSFASERTFHRSMVIAAGIALRSEQHPLNPFVRPLWKDPFPAGHFHAAAFSYRPLRKGEKDLKKTVTTLFVDETLQGVLHLLCDDRNPDSVEQSEFVRGACWIGPIAEVAEDSK